MDLIQSTPVAFSPPMTNDILSNEELTSLKEVNRGAVQRAIPATHAEHLLELGLIYRLLGSLRITSAGMARLRAHRG